MSSPQAANSPARSAAPGSHLDGPDASTDIAGSPVEGNGDGTSNQTTNSPAPRPEHPDLYNAVRDASGGVSELPTNNSSQSNILNPFDQHIDAGHHYQDDAFGDVSGFRFDDFGQHEQANGHENCNAVHDAFAALSAVPANDLNFDHNPFDQSEFTSNHNNADITPKNLELSLQRALGPTQNQDGNLSPKFEERTADACNKKPQAPVNAAADGEFNFEKFRAQFLFGELSPDQQTAAVGALAERTMDAVYHDLMRSHGFQPIPYLDPATDPLNNPHVMPLVKPFGTFVDPFLTEANYLPVVFEPDMVEEADPDADPNVPPPPPLRPIYPAFTGRFTSGPAARAYRKRNRVPRKDRAPDVERVKRFGRMYWVRRIYESMIDVTNICDSESSIHRTRFSVSRTFNPTDMEAAAHHVFDEAVAVHERGWVRSEVYHKKVVRGKLLDVSENCLERRLARICFCLRHKKATCDDVMRGGVTLALLCDNPEARGFTKLSNNAGNAKRGLILKAAKDAGVDIDVDVDVDVDVDARHATDDEDDEDEERNR